MKDRLLPPGTTRGRLARALLAAVRCLHPLPHRRGEPGEVLEALGRGYPYRWWLRQQRRRRGLRRGPRPDQLGLECGAEPGDLFEPDAGLLVREVLGGGLDAVVFHHDIGGDPRRIRLVATPGPVAWYATGCGDAAMVSNPGHERLGWQDVARIDELLLHRNRGGAPVPARRPDEGTASIAVVVPSPGNTAHLERFLGGLQDEDGVAEVVIVDNSRPEPAKVDFYRRWAERLHLEVIRTEPDAGFNYSRANNLGARATTSEVIAFCNDDLEFIEHPSLSRLAGWLTVPGVGVAGPQLRYPDGTIQHGGVVLGLNGLAEHAFTGMDPGTDTMIGNTDDARDVSAVTGACLVTTREVFESVDGFDEELVLTGSDVWFCLNAAQRGHHCVYDGRVALVHHESVTRGSENPLGDVVGSAERWGGRLAAGDPYWSRLLAIHRHEPTLRRRRDPTSAEMLLDHLHLRGVSAIELQRIGGIIGGAGSGPGPPLP